MTQTRKRFIAGAECPACQAQDTLQLLIEGDKEQVSCVQCGHTFSERSEQTPAKTSAPAPAAEGLIGIFKPD